MVNRRLPAVILVLLVLAGVAGATYVVLNPAAAYWRELPSPSGSMKGDVVLMRDGKRFYFDGRRWTDRPIAPRDLPF